MDIRYRCRAQLEDASPKIRAAFYQCRYDNRRIGQMLRLLQACLWKGAPDVRTELFADYKNKLVLDINDLELELQSYDVIAFDVFDTLICRTVPKPVDVFGCLEDLYHVPGFKNRRIEAEGAARRIKYGQCGTREVTIEEIYHVLDMQDGGNVISAEQEFAMEMTCCVANPELHRLVGALLAAGKQVIAVSDMYLHGPQVERLLCKCGYKGFGRIYVSCDCGAGKGDGRLFPLVVQELGKGRRLVHVGDNFYSDVYRPQECGVYTLHYLKNNRDKEVRK